MTELPYSLEFDLRFRHMTRHMMVEPLGRNSFLCLIRLSPGKGLDGMDGPQGRDGMQGPQGLPGMCVCQKEKQL